MKPHQFKTGDIKMTKKHFELIAKVMNKNITDTAPEVTEVRYSGATLSRAIAKQFAYVLAKTNPSFDRKRFLKACGIDDTAIVD